ncbi:MULTISPECIES: nuclear transport factor 2 family protein [Nocardia]|uniref:hypothetical protein n=1 Tax=Nocardia abscessus TaxID=120957 RepID=UPI0018955320|nr:hypothetical protein [Nocardia abscessus]MBF6472500.1 hypothetical protein [Nocardia abscessus]
MQNPEFRDAAAPVPCGRLEELASCFTLDDTLELRGTWSATGREAIVAQLTAASSSRNRIDADGFFIRHLARAVEANELLDPELVTDLSERYRGNIAVRAAHGAIFGARPAAENSCPLRDGF